MDFVVETFTIFDGFLDNFGLRHEKCDQSLYFSLDAQPEIQILNGH